MHGAGRVNYYRLQQYPQRFYILLYMTGCFYFIIIIFFAACDGINALDWEKLLITCNLRISMIVMQYTKVTLLSYHCLTVFSKNSAAGNLKTISGVP